MTHLLCAQPCPVCTLWLDAATSERKIKNNNNKHGSSSSSTSSSEIICETLPIATYCFFREQFFFRLIRFFSFAKLCLSCDTLLPCKKKSANAALTRQISLVIYYKCHFEKQFRRRIVNIDFFPFGRSVFRSRTFLAKWLFQFKVLRPMRGFVSFFRSNLSELRDSRVHALCLWLYMKQFVKNMNKYTYRAPHCWCSPNIGCPLHRTCTGLGPAQFSVDPICRKLYTISCVWGENELNWNYCANIENERNADYWIESNEIKILLKCELTQCNDFSFWSCHFWTFFPDNRFV